MILFVALIASQPALPSSTPIKGTEGVAVEQRIGAQVPLELEFTDETGQSGPLGRFFGTKPVVLALVYYECPMLCTMVLNGMLRALRAVTLDAGTDFEVVVVSIDPREGPELAAKKRAGYLKNYGRPSGEKSWHFLTGREPEIKQLAAAVGFGYAYNEEIKQYAHPATISVLTPEGKVGAYLDGVEYSAKDLRFALIEASEHKVGNIVDRVLLMCFHYDPTRGKYGLVVMNVLRLAGGATALAIAAFIGAMLLRERRAITAEGR